MLYKEYPFVTVEVDEAEKVIILTWNGSFSSAHYREAFLYNLQLATEKNLKFWLTDATEIGEITPEDQKWTSTHVWPALSQMGIKKKAIIIPNNVYSHLAISNIVVRGKENCIFETHYFVKPKEALAWFKLLPVARKF